MLAPEHPLDRIAALIMAKRRETGLGLRASASAAGINPATMSRLERRVTPNLPDSATLQKLAVWLGISLQRILGESQSAENSAPTPSVPEVVEVHLRADHKLTADKAATLAKMFKILYENAVSEPHF